MDTSKNFLEHECIYININFFTRMSAFGVVTAVLCNILIYFFKNYWVILFSFVLFGLGIGIAYYPILKTCWKYFPEKKGLITGIVLCCFGLSPFAFTSLADWIINNEGIPPDNEGIFPESVANRMKTYALVMAIVFSVLGVFALLLMFPMDNIESNDKADKKPEQNEEEKNRQNKEKIENEDEKKEVIENEKDQEAQNEGSTQKDEEINDKPLKQAALSLKFHLFNLMSVGTLCKTIYF